MKPAIVLLTILVVGGAIVWLIDRLFYHTDKAENLDETEENDASDATPAQGCADEACGIRSICPSEQILVSQCKREIIYYDDEELDSFAGREADGYTAEEEEQWRDVLYTLQPGDLLGWGQSIKHRGLVMPASIQAEFLQLAAENGR
ncbi:MAG: phospholipase [Muribaculaceae bacterium]|nr:phospholipase [Muribaculaceae bacterium]